MIVGIDFSLTHLAVATGTTPGDLAVAVFGSPPAAFSDVTARMMRYHKLTDEVLTLILNRAVMLKSGARLVAIEQYAFSKGTAAIVTGECGGMLRDKLSKKYRVVEPTPTQIKKFAWGKGSGSKADVALAMQKRFGLEFHGDGQFDKYEACVCWFIAWGMINGVDSFSTSFQRDVVAEMLNPAPAKKAKSKRTA